MAAVGTMQKVDEPFKNETPSRKGGFPIATAIAILTGLISLVIFLTGKTSLPEIINTEKATATKSSTPAVTLAITRTDTPPLLPPPTATATPGGAITAAPMEFVMLIRPPTDEELDSVPSIWDLTKFRELAEPGVNNYTIRVTRASEYQWSCFFCATNDAFQAFMDSLGVELRIDGNPLPQGTYRVYDTPGTQGWLCRNWSAIISGWPADRSVFLEIRYTHKQPTTDGKDEFAAGEYRQLIVVVVKG
jgi:hypothetical protein